LAAAKKNSSNSSKPPSSDIVKPKPGGAADKDKAQNQDGNASDQKKRGGQKGHEGHFRPKFNEDQIDEVIEHTLTHCPSCGTELEDADRAPRVVQQVKIVVKPVKIEEHRGLPYWCPTCQCFHDAPMPKEVERGGLFDAKLTAGVASMMRELFEIVHLHDGCDASVFTALLQAKKSLILTAATTNVPIVPPAQQPCREAQNLAKRFVTHGESLSPVLRPNNFGIHHESVN